MPAPYPEGTKAILEEFLTWMHQAGVFVYPDRIDRFLAGETFHSYENLTEAEAARERAKDTGTLRSSLSDRDALKRERRRQRRLARKAAQ